MFEVLPAPPIATVRASPDSDCAVEEETRTQSRYSFLSATIGSICVARRAGTQDAIVATVAKTIDTARKVLVSSGVIPNSISRSSPVTAVAPMMPRVIPTVVSSRPWRRTRRQYLCARRSERQTHADLLSALDDRIREQTVYADHRQEACDARERGEHHRIEALPRDGVCGQADHRHDGLDADVRIHCLHDVAHHGNGLRRVATGPDRKRQEADHQFVLSLWLCPSVEQRQELAVLDEDLRKHLVRR